MRKRLAVAGALTGTVAMAAAVGASANPVPPKGIAAQQAALPSIAAPEPAPAAPTFKNGLAQAVFSTNSADWVSGEVWVQTDFDSDGDGQLDRVHADYTVPK